MKNFQRLALTAIALGAFAFPLGCQQQAKPVPKPAPAVPAKPAENLDLKLMKAAREKDLATVKDCVKRGANVNVKDPSGWTAGMWSVWHWFDDKPLCAYIMHSGGEFSRHQKDNLLERAARTGDADRAEAFIEWGANPNYVNAFGENCATLALRYFRGQYGVPEDDKAKPRYGDLGAINASIKQNTADLDEAEKRLAEILEAKKSYENAAELFEKSPHAAANERDAFSARELESAKAFAEQKKLSVPANAASAAQIYAALESEGKKARDAAYKNLNQTRFLALLKAKGANLRALLAGTQDDTGKQDNWKGQQDKWTVDPVARYGVSRALPVITEGLWDGELALIQLIGRGEEIFRDQVQETTTPITQEYLCALYLSENEKAQAMLGAITGLFETALENAMQARTITVERHGRVGNRFWNSRREITIQPELSLADLIGSAVRGAEKGAEIGRLLGALEFVEKGSLHLDLINSSVNEKNAKTRERNEKIFALFEELPLEGELAAEWKKKWEARLSRREKFAESLREQIRGQLESFVARREREIANMYKQGGNTAGDPLEIAKKFSQLEDEMEKQEAELEKAKKFLASDFFKKKSVAELAENPPNPREEDPKWYAEHCLGKLKSPQVFLSVAKEFLDYGADVNARANCTDAPALICALLWEKPEFEELLLGYGADRKLALFYVCERNDFDLLKKLLPRITDVSGVPADAAGDTILHRAVRAGRADLVGELVRRGAAVDARNKHEDTPLHLAAEIENEACVRALLENGADVNARDKDGRKPFQRFWNAPAPALTQIFVDAHAAAKK